MPELFDFSKCKNIFNLEQLKNFPDPSQVIPHWIENKMILSSNLNNISIKRPINRLV